MSKPQCFSYLAMPCRLIFRCEFCDAQPDAETHAELQRAASMMLFGTYVDADPGNWLVWHGRGIYGPMGYACGLHRDSLKANLRKHYGTVGPHPFAEGPHPASWLRRETLAQLRRRRALSSYPTFDPGRSA